MKKFIAIMAAASILFMSGAGYSLMFSHRNKRVRRFIVDLKNYISPWSLGIYEGSSPFDLEDPSHISNPVLTKDDVTDVDASFIADPFLTITEDGYYMFFEVFDKSTRKGSIGYAESKDGFDWDYKKIILEEPFHLSYPDVFTWKGEHYMIPESADDLSVRLYKAVSFPDKWRYEGNLLSGHRHVDPTIFFHDEMWWMFSSPERGALNLYYSADLNKGWMAHPQNPVIKEDRRMARPAGKVFLYEDKLYRLAQDGSSIYGHKVFACEIVELSENSYKEELASDKPVVSPTGKGWNAGRMHHADLHNVEGRWFGAVDGRVK